MISEIRGSGLRTHSAVLACYAAVAVLFWWPLPLHLADALPGPPGGDAGVYVWNLWLFRHEILAHHGFPFETLEILNAGAAPAVPMALHNYTPVAGALALPLIGWIGLVPTFNLLVIANGVLAAYAMFLFARRRTADAGAAFVGGLIFGFSPYMMVRSSDHFSLAQAAPLPIFGLLMLSLLERPTLRMAVLAGLTVAWAYLSDPYYAVYCLLIAAFMVGYSVVSVEPRAHEVPRTWWSTALTLLLVAAGALIVGIVLSGGGRIQAFGISISLRGLYTPVLAFTLLSIARIWLTRRGRLAWSMPFGIAHVRAAAVTAAIALIALAPVLYTMTTVPGERLWAGPPVWWRSSAPGVDAAAWLLPNPLHPWFGHHAARWLASFPNGYVENVASVPWTALGIVAVAWVAAGFRGLRKWWCFLGLFALISLGPFIHVAGLNTHVPTPWAFFRYLPVVGAARMPTRFTILIMMAVSMLVALAIASLRARGRQRNMILLVSVLVLLAELLPAPRPLFSAAVPKAYSIIAEDPRAVRVLNLPFGLRDGFGSHGRFSPAYLFYQTVHEKPLIGGYVSRLPPGRVDRYRRGAIRGVLLRLSEGERVPDDMIRSAVGAGPAFVERARLAYVVVNRQSASEDLVAFAEAAFSLTFVMEEDGFALYRTPLRNAEIAGR